MTKRGRPKKTGERYKCGKRTPQARTDEIMQTAIEGRMRVFGVSRDLAKTDVMGSPLQRLRHWNYITTTQADAGLSFAEIMREYLSSARLQRSSPTKANFVPGQFDSGDGPPVKGEVRARQYMEALTEIDRTDPYSVPRASVIVWKVCIDELDCVGEQAIGALRVGLNAIHRIISGRKAA